MSHNPYANPFPVKRPEDLYGRRWILETLFRQLFRADIPLSQQVVALTRMGKTSLLNVIACLNDVQKYQAFAKSFELELEQIRNVLFVSVDFSGLSANEPEVFWRLMGRQLGQAAESRFHNDALPLSGSKCANLDHLSEDLSHLIEEGYSIVYLLDEFDRVASSLPAGVTHNLRFLLEENREHLAYVTATRRELYDYYISRDDVVGVSPLFNYFDGPLYMGLLEESPDSKSVRGFVREPAEAAGVNFTDDDERFAFDVGGRHPDATRLVCMHLFEARQQAPEEELDYAEIKEQVFGSLEPWFHTIWCELPAPQQDALVRLTAGRPVAESIPEDILVNLMRLGLVIRRGASYQLFSPPLERFTRGSPDKTVPTGLKVWAERRAVQVGGKLELLSPSEWRLFEYLHKHAGRVCTREELRQVLSSGDAHATKEVLEITVSRLRKKLEENPSLPKLIVTVRGRGYRFETQNAQEEMTH